MREWKGTEDRANAINILMQTVFASPFHHVKAWERRMARVLTSHRRCVWENQTGVLWLCGCTLENGEDFSHNSAVSCHQGRQVNMGEIYFKCLCKIYMYRTLLAVIYHDSKDGHSGLCSTPDKVFSYLVLLIMTIFLNKVNVKYTFTLFIIYYI